MLRRSTPKPTPAPADVQVDYLVHLRDCALVGIDQRLYNLRGQGTLSARDAADLLLDVRNLLAPPGCAR